MSAAALAAELVRTDPRPVVDPRSIPVRHSRLKKMQQSAAHYIASILDDTDDTLAMRLGRGTHAMVLGEPVVKWDQPAKNGKGGKAPRTGEAWEAFVAEHAGVEILNATEWEEASRMADAILAHPFASQLLKAPDVVLEKTIEWSLNGRACTSRPDARHGFDTLIDVKTTRSSEPQKFSRDAQWMGYHSQFSFYGEAMLAAGGKRPDNNFIIAVEKSKPHVVTVFEVAKRAVAEGEKFWRLWWERLMVCEATNVWPGYTQTIEVFDIVDDGEFTLRVGGEDVDL